MLDLCVNGPIPGDKVNVERGDSLQITVRAFRHANQVPLDTLELISHGRVIGRTTALEAGGPAGSPERFRGSRY